MPARNRYHRQLRNALESDGWTITHDPFHLKWGARDLLVDLGAEKLLGAEKGTRRLAVEVQSFLGASVVEDLEHAVGQFTVYRKVLARVEPERELYVAVRQVTFANLFEEPLGQLMLDEDSLRLLVFDPEKEAILRWIP